MNNKTLETLNQSFARIETIIEVDTTLKQWETKQLQDIVDLLQPLIDENTK